MALLLVLLFRYRTETKVTSSGHCRVSMPIARGAQTPTISQLTSFGENGPKMKWLLMSLTYCALLHVRDIIFTYPLYGWYMRFITVGAVDMYPWYLSFSSILYMYGEHHVDMQHSAHNDEQEHSTRLFDSAARHCTHWCSTPFIWKPGKSILVNSVLIQARDNSYFLLFAIVLSHRVHSKKVWFYALLTSR